jgi:hypothetical protein
LFHIRWRFAQWQTFPSGDGKVYQCRLVFFAFAAPRGFEKYTVTPKCVYEVALWFSKRDQGPDNRSLHKHAEQIGIYVSSTAKFTMFLNH